jgi:predicted RNA-binding protein
MTLRRATEATKTPEAPSNNGTIDSADTAGKVPETRPGVVMCESDAYLVTEAGEEKIMEDVAALAFDGEIIVLTSLLGDEMRLDARLAEIAFLDHKIVLEPRTR